MNIISKENLKLNSPQLLRSLIQSSSEMNGCPITNIIEKEIKSIWLSEESLPQEIILNINKNYFIHYPKKLSAIGIYCWHAYSTNPKQIEILINNNKNTNFISLGDFDLGLKPGMQLLHLDEDLLLDNEENKLNDNICIKLIIKETFGGKRTYINNLSLYEDIDVNELNLKSIQEENDEEENSSTIFLRESRNKNIFKNNLKKNNINNGNILLTSEILISDSELSERKNFGEKVDKFLGLNSKLKIPEMSETKENNSTLKNNNSIKYNKIKINNSNNNNLNSNNARYQPQHKNKSPLKSNGYIISDKNLLYSDKKSFLNSNIFNANNNLNINTQTSQNNLNNQLLTTEMMKSQIDYQNDFFSPEKQNKFLCSKGEISNIEYPADNQLLINEFHSYQKSQDEKMKKFEERITKIENKIEDINSTIKNINENLNNLINKEKLNETENKNYKDEIIKECEKMIKNTLIEILDKKINPEILADNKKININNEMSNLNSLNFSSNKIPESKFNRYEKNFYQTHYNNNYNNNKNTLDYSNYKNISIEQNDNYMTHQLPFYQNNNKINSISNSNSNNNIIVNHKRNSTFSHNYLNLNKNNLDENYNNIINNSQSIKNENKYNISINNFSEFSESHIKDNKYNTIRTPYYDFKTGSNSSTAQFYNSNSYNHTPLNNYNIPHKNKKNANNIKGYIFKDRNYNYKENTLKLTKNKSSNFSSMSYKKNNTINNSHNHNTPKVLTSKRKHSHTNINNKEEIANKINNHLEEKFADFSDKLGKNINDYLLKPSIEKLKKNMKKKIKQVKNSLKKAEISQRSNRKDTNS